MKADYKNWVPKTMLYLLDGSALIFYMITICSRLFLGVGIIKDILPCIFLLIALLLTIVLVWMVRMYQAFSYNGHRKLSRDIIEGLTRYVTVPKGGLVLDVGCGSGALTIAVAKRNPLARVIGLDRWGKEYGSYNKKLCERNAKAEKVDNVDFIQGDAVQLDFPDESFDAVTSNYVYHNITGVNRQDLLLETLRLVKKGGTFAIHDIFSKGKYGDMKSFVQKLKDLDYEEVLLIDTTSGKFMTKTEAAMYSLKHSAILYGKK